MPLERLAPRFVERVWGATRLEPWFSRTGNNADTSKIGEVWFEPPAALGLLIKFLFTSQNLSVQVHPDDAYAALHHHSGDKPSRGKTEMWHILRAEPGVHAGSPSPARIAAGFREPLSKDQARAAAESGEIVDLLEWHDAAPGDTFFIPAGTVHAIGAGMVLCEIQQLSDITYRLYDYGRGRKLHLDHGLEVSRLEPSAPRATPQGDLLVSCPYFTVSRHRVDGTLQFPAPQVLIVAEGQGQCAHQPIYAGEVWYCSPDTPPLNLSGNLTLLGASAPHMRLPA